MARMAGLGGVSASSSPALVITDSVTIGGYVLSGFTYLTDPNEVPSFGLQTVWETMPNLTVVQNLYYGPDQRDTDLRFWRFFSDSISPKTE